LARSTKRSARFCRMARMLFTLNQGALENCQ
jgi:hypothetical protein